MQSSRQNLCISYEELDFEKISRKFFRKNELFFMIYGCFVWKINWKTKHRAAIAIYCSFFVLFCLFCFVLILKQIFYHFPCKFFDFFGYSCLNSLSPSSFLFVKHSIENFKPASFLFSIRSLHGASHNVLNCLFLFFRWVFLFYFFLSTFEASVQKMSSLQ